MTDNEMRVAIARLGGFDKVCGSGREAVGQKNGRSEWIPDYLNSHDALAPVLAGLSDAEELAYICSLAGSNFTLFGIESVRAIVRATPRQKCEALMRAKGLWA